MQSKFKIRLPPEPRVNFKMDDVIRASTSSNGATRRARLRTSIRQIFGHAAKLWRKPDHSNDSLRSLQTPSYGNTLSPTNPDTNVSNHSLHPSLPTSVPSIDPTSLKILPNDLLFEILQLVSIPRKNYPTHPNQRCLGTQDLLSMMRCCHQLRDIGEPILYRNYVQRTSSGLSTFIQTILARPNLADYVRTVHLDERGFNHHMWQSNFNNEELKVIESVILSHLSEYQHPVGNQDTKDSSTIQSRREPQSIEDNQALSELGTSSSSPSRIKITAAFLMAQIQRGNWHALAAFVLYLLPHVSGLETNLSSKISFNTPEALLTNHLPTIFTTSLSTSKILPNIHHLTLNNHVSDGKLFRLTYNSLSELAPLTNHPYLRSLHLDNIHITSSTEETLDLNMPQVTNLWIERSNIASSALKQFLKAFPNLEKLKYEHDYPSNMHRTDLSIFCPRDFGRAIEHLKPTLEELSVYRAERYNCSVGRQGMFEQFSIIGSLVGFEKLSSLSITASLLLGPQKCAESSWYSASQSHNCPALPLSYCLPRSLEKLRLMESGDLIVHEHISSLVEQSSWLIPKLTSLTLHYLDLRHSRYFGGFRNYVVRRDLCFPNVSQKDLEGLEGECKARGIEFDIWYD